MYILLGKCSTCELQLSCENCYLIQNMAWIVAILSRGIGSMQCRIEFSVDNEMGAVC